MPKRHGKKNKGVIPMTPTATPEIPAVYKPSRKQPLRRPYTKNRFSAMTPEQIRATNEMSKSTREGFVFPVRDK
jgi:hypothetical protein